MAVLFFQQDCMNGATFHGPFPHDENADAPPVNRECNPPKYPVIFKDGEKAEWCERAGWGHRNYEGVVIGNGIPAPVLVSDDTGL